MRGPGTVIAVYRRSVGVFLDSGFFTHERCIIDATPFVSATASAISELRWELQNTENAG
jgi:hypothetical protein